MNTLMSKAKSALFSKILYLYNERPDKWMANKSPWIKNDISF